MRIMSGAVETSLLGAVEPGLEDKLRSMEPDHVTEKRAWAQGADGSGFISHGDPCAFRQTTKSAGLSFHICK